MQDNDAGLADRLRAALLASVAAASLVGCASDAAEKADLILTNARVYTVEVNQPWAEAVAVREGRILAVGTRVDIERLAGSETRTVDLGGRLLMPAFGDGHVHPVFGGMAYSRCSLHKGKSVDEYVTLISACLAATPGDGPLYGVGWQDALFPPNGVPHKEVLDGITKTRALVFESVGGHSYWVNSKALELGGITKATPDPANGTINRDERTGEPSGGLQESAMGLVGSLIPKPTQKEVEASIIYTSQMLNGFGVTTFHDAGVALDMDGMSETLDAYGAVKGRGELTSHVSIALTWANDRSFEQIPQLIDASKRVEAMGLRAKTVKYYVDGVIPQRTAAMIAPYEDSADERGSLQIAPDVLSRAVTELGAAGFQAHVHAIGDRATRIALDAFEAANVKNGAGARPMISHLNVIDPADQPRFGKLGAIAVFQPTWSANYPYMDLTKQAIGPVRSQYIYPANSVLKGGGMLAYGADWPVATANPLEGLQVAVTRINYEDGSQGPLLPAEGVTLEEAVKAHTLNVAYANGLEGLTGSIAAGKSADLIVLDKDIFAIPVGEISKAKVLTTIFQGQEVFGSLTDLGSQPTN